MLFDLCSLYTRVGPCMFVGYVVVECSEKTIAAGIMFKQVIRVNYYQQYTECFVDIMEHSRVCLHHETLKEWRGTSSFYFFIYVFFRFLFYIKKNY